jgi:hypothetical protein
MWGGNTFPDLFLMPHESVMIISDISMGYNSFPGESKFWNMVCYNKTLTTKTNFCYTSIS